MGTGSATGEGRIEEATRMAINSPLLEDVSMSGAKGVLINITGSSSMSLTEINDAVSIIQSEAHDDANIIFGAVIDEDMGDAVNVTVIATGFGRSESGLMDKTDSLLFAKSPTPSTDENKIERSAARTIIPNEPRDSQIPAFIRKSQREKGSRHLNVVDDFSIDGEEDLDIPTFLRKHAE